MMACHGDFAITRRFYDRISRVYDVVADASEHAIRDCGVRALGLSPGERVLEVGCGTGHGLVAISRAVGRSGLACGVDVSSGMTAVARDRLARGADGNVALALCDARALCFLPRRFDAVLFSFTLELFGEAVPTVLAEAIRVLRPGGRVGVVAMDSDLQPGLGTPVYRWLHEHFPHAVDCGPIDVVGVMTAAGLGVEFVHATRIWSLPVKAVIATHDGGVECASPPGPHAESPNH
jgi:demethylmenaquinone methyltransferase/2-methoxy-6-polyprenyl-1,4-benzoquinol methylase